MSSNYYILEILSKNKNISPVDGRHYNSLLCKDSLDNKHEVVISKYEYQTLFSGQLIYIEASEETSFIADQTRLNFANFFSKEQFEFIMEKNPKEKLKESKIILKSNYKLLSRLITKEASVSPQTLFNFFESNTVIAGGFFAQYLMDRNDIDSDIDIFLTRREDKEAFRKLLISCNLEIKEFSYKQETASAFMESSYAFTLDFKPTFPRKVNVIYAVNDEIQTPFKLFNRFDFQHCCVAFTLTDNKIHLAPGALDCILNKKIRFNRNNLLELQKNITTFKNIRGVFAGGSNKIRQLTMKEQNFLGTKTIEEMLASLKISLKHTQSRIEKFIGRDMVKDDDEGFELYEKIVEEVNNLEA